MVEVRQSPSVEDPEGIKIRMGKGEIANDGNGLTRLNLVLVADNMGISSFQERRTRLPGRPMRLS